MSGIIEARRSGSTGPTLDLIRSQNPQGAAASLLKILADGKTQQFNDTKLREIVNQLKQLKDQVSAGSVPLAHAETITAQVVNLVNQNLITAGSDSRLTVQRDGNNIPTITLGRASNYSYAPNQVIDLQAGALDLETHADGTHFLLAPGVGSDEAQAAFINQVGQLSPSSFDDNEMEAIMSLATTMAEHPAETAKAEAMAYSQLEQWAGKPANRSFLASLNQEDREKELKKMWDQFFVKNMEQLLGRQGESRGEETGTRKGKSQGQTQATGGAGGGGGGAAAMTTAGQPSAVGGASSTQGGGVSSFGGEQADTLVDSIMGGDDPITLAIGIMMLLIKQKGQDVRETAERLKASMSASKAAGREYASAKQAAAASPDDPGAVGNLANAEAKKDEIGGEQTLLQIKLQQLMAQYTEAVQNATALIKARHDAVQGVARNIA